MRHLINLQRLFCYGNKYVNDNNIYEQMRGIVERQETMVLDAVASQMMIAVQGGV